MRRSSAYCVCCDNSVRPSVSHTRVQGRIQMGEWWRYGTKPQRGPGALLLLGFGQLLHDRPSIWHAILPVNGLNMRKSKPACFITDADEKMRLSHPPVSAAVRVQCQNTEHVNISTLTGSGIILVFSYQTFRWHFECVTLAGGVK